MDTAQMMTNMAQQARRAARAVAVLDSHTKNQALLVMADGLMKSKNAIQEANRKDVGAGKAAGLSAAMIDRLTLSDKVVQSMADGLREVSTLPDPVGEVTGMWRRPNGLQVGRVRIPLGVIGFIYESRPNVTVDAAALCLKSGNAVILKGGSEAIHSNLAIAEVVSEALKTLWRSARGRSGRPDHGPHRRQPFADHGRLCGPDHSPRRGRIDSFRGGKLPHPGAQTLQGAYATSSWTIRPIWIWPRPSVSTPRCSAPVFATPWKPCWSIRMQPTTFCPVSPRPWRKKV